MFELYDWTGYAAHIEQKVQKEAMMEKASKENIKELKRGASTRLATSRYRDVIDYVAEATKCPEVRECRIYDTCIADLKSVQRKASKRIRDSEESPEFYEIATKASAEGLIEGIAFFCLVTKDIFIIKDAHLLHYHFGKDKKKRGDKKHIKSMPKPSRFTVSHWVKVRQRASVAHELFHFAMDIKTHTDNHFMQEEYAYTNMIGWLQKEGIKDNEIELFVLPFAKMIAVGEDQSLMLKENRKKLEKKGKEEAKKIIKRFNGEESLSVNTREEDLAGRFDLDL